MAEEFLRSKVSKDAFESFLKGSPWNFTTRHTFAWTLILNFDKLLRDMLNSKTLINMLLSDIILLYRDSLFHLLILSILSLFTTNLLFADSHKSIILTLFSFVFHFAIRLLLLTLNTFLGLLIDLKSCSLKLLVHYFELLCQISDILAALNTGLILFELHQGESQ